MTHTLRGLGEFIAYLPYELGFVPTDSLVAAGLSQGSVDVLARLDLTPQDGFLAAIDRTAAVFARSGIDEAICCVVLDGAVAVSRASTLLDRAKARFCREGIGVRHLLVTTDHVWWAHSCECLVCPTEPTDVPRPERVAAVFASVLEGVAPVSSRGALAVGLRGLRAGVASRVEAEFVKGAALSDEALVSALREILYGEKVIDRMPPDLLAAISVSLIDPIRRDDVFGWVTPGIPVSPPGSVTAPTSLQRAWVMEQRQAAVGGVSAVSAAALRERMTQWLHCLPDPLRPPVLTFIAGSAWSSGAGALAAVAVEVSQTIDPEYRLAQLLARVLDAGLRPGRHPKPIETSAEHC